MRGRRDPHPRPGAATSCPGVPDAEPTVVSVTPDTDLDVEAVKSGPAELTLTTGPQVDGTARFRIVMSDVADPLSDERQVDGLHRARGARRARRPDRAGARAAPSAARRSP